jgi:hypothetical protein
VYAVSKSLMNEIYKIVILPAFFPTKELGLRVFENKVLRRIPGSRNIQEALEI